jgi:hypothetical protein
MSNPQVKLYLSNEYLKMIETYGREHDIIAKTGRNTGEVNRSEVVRLAIEKLATCNGDKAPASPDEAPL